MAKRESFVVNGPVYWAKVLGDPVDNYSKDGKEWTLDITVDDETKKIFKDLGIEDRVKNKGDERGDFVQFRQREKRMDGTLNRPISVVDENGDPWPQDKLIGNGTIVDLRFDFQDYGKGKFPGIYPKAIRVRELNEYAPQYFEPLKDEEKVGKKEGQLPEGMEPEVEDEFPE